MNKQQLKEQSLLHLLSQNNFIVPEIQREYVWGQNEEVLSRFLDSIVEKIGSVCDQCGNPKTNTKINVGFLYTYKPSYVMYNYERFLDENLIDGQQRFTTLFLLLFYSSLKEGRIQDFKEVVRLDGDLSMAFDYKVRTLTHIFLLQLVNKIQNVSDLELIFQSKTRATWFLSDFEIDITINSIIKALQVIHTKFKDRTVIVFDYILNNIKFYHFRTEVTNQGEELYITMNARGEALSKNEENKAALMLDDASLFEFGKKWEDWQDFFWKHRDKSNPDANADIGFNEFLRWIQIIEMTLSDKDIDINEDDKIPDQSLMKDIITLIQGEIISLKKEYFPIEKIEKYFASVQYLFNHYFGDEGYESKYNGLSDKCILKQTYLHPNNKRIEQLESFELLPVLSYIYKLQASDKPINNQNIFRLFRFLNNIKKDTNIKKSINKQVINAIKLVDILLASENDDIAKISHLKEVKISKTLLTNEELFKFNLYLNSHNREELESIFWQAEDNKILNGKIAPLIKYSYYDGEEKRNFDFQKTFESFKDSSFNMESFKDLYKNFLKLTKESANLSDNIWGAMLLTDYYQIKPYNQDHKLVTCSSTDDFDLIRSKYFLNKLDEVAELDSADEYFNNIFQAFLSPYANNIQALSQETDYKRQLYAYSIALIEGNNWHFNRGKKFGVYLTPQNYTSFFTNGVRFQHYRQNWVGADYNYFNDNMDLMTNFYQNKFI